ncbi:hypothetical protein BDY19DRAFT_920550 [Irpex rosettiformis]|uniref:Uncharacterized protein n=1 Tax=Irpex rosettiformis TaxID=378272 RepID=A0ACB8UI62_9APHY|nr:hypothetical protein BDY19DRAFT_920550 [Irpex rosettiformis]
MLPVFRLVTFTEPEQYIEACTPFDDSFMNFPLGTLLDSIDPRNATLFVDDEADPSMRIMLAVYNADQLVVSLVKVSAEFAWSLGTPRGIEESLDASEVSSIVALLVQGIVNTTGPTSFDKVIGPRGLVNALVDGWVAFSKENGQTVKPLDPFMISKVAYATQHSLPAPSPAFAQLKIEQAVMNDADALVPFMLDFLAHGPHVPDEERTRSVLRVKIPMRHIWVCRIDNEVAAFGAVGRITPRTIAIRNIYVSPSHRRKGIAEALVRALTRYYLGAKPLGFKGGPLNGPVEGVKEEVNLNVGEEAVERIYKRCGFLLDQEEHNEGKKGWFHSVFRGVEYL